MRPLYCQLVNLTYFDQHPTSDLVCSRSHGRVDAVNTLIHLALVVFFTTNKVKPLPTMSLAIAVTTTSFIQVYLYTVFRPHLVQSVNATMVGAAALRIWIALCVIVSVMLNRQVRVPVSFRHVSHVGMYAGMLYASS